MFVRSQIRESDESYLKNGERKGMSQVSGGLEHLLPVVAVQVDATEHVQLRVHPVQPAFD